MQKSVFKWNTIWVFIFPKSCSWCPLGFFGTSTVGFLVVVFILLQSMKAQMLPKPILVWGTAPKIVPKVAKISITFSLILFSQNDLKLNWDFFNFFNCDQINSARWQFPRIYQMYLSMALIKVSFIFHFIALLHINVWKISLDVTHLWFDLCIICI